MTKHISTIPTVMPMRSSQHYLSRKVNYESNHASSTINKKTCHLKNELSGGKSSIKHFKGFGGKDHLRKHSESRCFACCL